MHLHDPITHSWQSQQSAVLLIFYTWKSTFNLFTWYYFCFSLCKCVFLCVLRVLVRFSMRSALFSPIFFLWKKYFQYRSICCWSPFNRSMRCNLNATFGCGKSAREKQNKKLCIPWHKMLITSMKIEIPTVINRFKRNVKCKYKWLVYSAVHITKIT